MIDLSSHRIEIEHDTHTCDHPTGACAGQGRDMVSALCSFEDCEWGSHITDTEIAVCAEFAVHVA